jgi:hypothetical protein
MALEHSVTFEQIVTLAEREKRVVAYKPLIRYVNDAIFKVYVTVIFFKPPDICYKIYNHLYQNTPSQICNIFTLGRAHLPEVSNTAIFLIFKKILKLSKATLF